MFRSTPEEKTLAWRPVFRRFAALARIPGSDLLASALRPAPERLRRHEQRADVSPPATCDSFAPPGRWGEPERGSCTISALSAGAVLSQQRHLSGPLAACPASRVRARQAHRRCQRDSHNDRAAPDRQNGPSCCPLALPTPCRRATAPPQRARDAGRIP